MRDVYGRDPFANYDRWLEEPYQRMVDESDAFVDWAENEGYDLDDPDDAQLAEDNYDMYLSDVAEMRAEAQYEAYVERMEMEAEERGEWWEWEDDQYHYEY